MNDSNSPASGTTVPLPVDLERVEDAVDALGYEFLATDDRIIMPWPNHRVSAYFGRDSGLHLTVLARMRMTLDLFTLNEVARMLNLWNEERIGPVALLHVGDEGEVEIRFRSTVCVDEGLTPAQLEQFLAVTLGTMSMASDHAIEAFSELAVQGAGSEELRTEQDEQDLEEKIRGLVPPPARPHPGTGPGTDPAEGRNMDPEQHSGHDPSSRHPSRRNSRSAEQSAERPAAGSPDDPEAYPAEVTLDRVQEHLNRIGVVKTSAEEDFIIAWINDVFLGFFIDNGPTFLVKGHWDPGLDPERDFIKLFMMCNQWNENSLTTKAFCHRDDTGLQVRVEFTVPVSEGLTDAQLRHNITLSIHHILQAIDSLSTEATGSSVVDWPEQD